MNLVIRELMENKILGLSVFSLLLAQFLKIFTYFIIFRDWKPSRAFGSGGMPSSHSSFVSTLATSIGLVHGFDSSYFAIAAVGAAIVMYDASGVRMAVGKQAKVINEIQRLVSVIVSEEMEVEDKLKELIGHTKLEVLVGGLLGILVASIGYMYF